MAEVSLVGGGGMGCECSKQRAAHKQTHWGNAMSLARTHRKMWTKSRVIGVQCEQTAAGQRLALDPNFEGRGPHFLMSPS